MNFEYNALNPDEMELVFQRGLLRIIPLKESNFGRVLSPDGD